MQRPDAIAPGIWRNAHLNFRPGIGPMGGDRHRFLATDPQQPHPAALGPVVISPKTLNLPLADRGGQGA